MENTTKNKFFSIGRNYGFSGDEIAKNNIKTELHNQNESVLKDFDNSIIKIQSTLNSCVNNVQKLSETLKTIRNDANVNIQLLITQKNNPFIGFVKDTTPQKTTLNFYNKSFASIILLIGIFSSIGGISLFYINYFHLRFNDVFIGIFVSAITYIGVSGLLSVLIFSLLSSSSVNSIKAVRNLSYGLLFVILFSLFLIEFGTSQASILFRYAFNIVMCLGLVLIKVGIDSYEINNKIKKFAKQEKEIERKVSEAMDQSVLIITDLRNLSFQATRDIIKNKDSMHLIDEGFSHGKAIRDFLSLK